MNEQANPNDKRNAAIVWCITFVLAAVMAVLIVEAASAEIHQCRAVAGCVCTKNQPDGSQKKYMMRKGDIVADEAGWVVSTDDGWFNLSRESRNRGGDCWSGWQSTYDGGAFELHFWHKACAHGCCLSVCRPTVYAVMQPRSGAGYAYRFGIECGIVDASNEPSIWYSHLTDGHIAEPGTSGVSVSFACAHGVPFIVTPYYACTE